MAVPTLRPKSAMVEMPLAIALINEAVIAPPLIFNNSLSDKVITHMVLALNSHQ